MTNMKKMMKYINDNVCISNDDVMVILSMKAILMAINDIINDVTM